MLPILMDLWAQGKSIEDTICIISKLGYILTEYETAWVFNAITIEYRAYVEELTGIKITF